MKRKYVQAMMTGMAAMLAVTVPVTTVAAATPEKEQTVYVNADQNGNVEKVIVSNWLKNTDKESTLEDNSELNDITNVKGEESYTQGSDGKLVWAADGNDIYYQGTIDKELPVDVKVSYKLDGKSISPKDLKGKSGKVEIQFSYDNKSKQTVNVNGEDVEMYTPFTMVSAMMLSSDEYSNVSVENGKLISDGDKNIVVGVAFPGLANDLNLKDLDMDIDIPETVTITADVKDATVGTSITMASAELMNEFGLDDIDSFDDLQDSIDDLEDATNQLVDGSKEAADGSKELADGAGTLNDGAGTLAGGAGTLADGVNTLNEKSGTLVSGVNTLASGVGTYTAGVASIAKNSQLISDNMQSLQGGVNKLEEQIAAQATQGLGEIKTNINNAKTGVDQINSAITTSLGEGKPGVQGILSNASQALTGADVTIDQNDVNVTVNSVSLKNSESVNKIIEDSALSDDEKNALKNAINSAITKDNMNIEYKVELNENGNSKLNSAQQKIATANGLVTTANGALSQLSDSMNTISGGLSALAGENGIGQLEAAFAKNGSVDQGFAQLGQGVSELAAGTQALADGAAELNKNSAPLMAGVTSLKDGGSQLASGVSQLASGANQVADGAGILAGGTQTLLDGANTLADGNQTLADGMQEYKEEAIDKLTDLFNGDISGVTDRIDAMTNLAKEYKSFAGISDGVSGTTKFIIETEGIDD